MSENKTIQEITKASSIFFKKTLRYYTFEDIISKAKRPYKNLYEMCFQYPTKGFFFKKITIFFDLGVGFKVWRKTWPKNCYYLVHDVKVKVIF